MSDFAPTIEKFNGNNWDKWQFGVQAALMFMEAWDIAQGTETRPIPAGTAATTAETTSIASWDKRERQGRSLLVLVVESSIYQSINLTQTLAQNWTVLKAKYGKRTGLNAWVDFRQYITTIFDTTSPLSQQIDTLSELHAKIVLGGLTVSDQLHALVTLGSLPASFEIIQSSIIDSYADLTTISFSDIRARILAEELCQSSGNVSAINRPGTKGPSKDKKTKTTVTCHWCSKKGHYSNECMAKKAGLSKEDCKDEEKRKEGVKRVMQKEGRTQAKVSAVISEAPDTDNVNVNTTDESSPFVFYITRSTKWMIDSGCTEHITPFAADFSDFTKVTTHGSVTLADSATHYEIKGQGTVKATTTIDGKKVEIQLPNVLYIPGFRKRYISTRQLTPSPIIQVVR